MDLPAPSVMDIALTKSAEIFPALKIPHLMLLFVTITLEWLDETVIVDK
jgi:hypothetical protein